MDYPLESARDQLREVLRAGAKMVTLGEKDLFIAYDPMPIELVVERFLQSYPKFEECREKLLAKLKMEHPSGQMDVPRGCQLARSDVQSTS